MKTNKEDLSWLDRLDEMVAENSRLSLFLLMQFATIFLLIIGYMKVVDKVQVKIELPSIIKEEGTIIVGKEFSSETYFRMWGREDVEIISTFNHKDIKDKLIYLRNRMYPPFYYKNEKLFKQYEEQISKDLITQKFNFAKEDMKIELFSDRKEAMVSIDGFYSKTIDEDTIIEAQKCQYLLGYMIKGGHIYVSSFKTTCK